MAEKTELETETEGSPEAAAELLRNVAGEISSGGEITVEGNDASMTVPGTAEEIGTELEVEHEVRGDYDRVELEIELEWTIVPEEGDDPEPDEG